MKKYPSSILILIVLFFGSFNSIAFAQVASGGGVAGTSLGAPMSPPTAANPNPGNTLAQSTNSGLPQNYVQAMTNNGCIDIGNGSIPGCMKQFFYYVIYTPSAAILTVAGNFFNALVALALFSTLTAQSTFIPTAWVAVRDLSNLFFILILLYISIRLILGLGGHDTKKMIAKVIIVALLINFSMFFTEVVIDSSNILALIFYNKLQVNTPNPTTSGNTPVNRSYNPVTGSTAEKDISGGIWNGFDITYRLDSNFWNKTMKVNVPDATQQSTIPVSVAISVTLIAAAIMLFASYAFFISGLAFVGRLIELWILIIFSPFAFMSSTIPILSKTEYLGWDDWLKRLLKTSFMAPIFMFFLYLIFLLLGANTFYGLIANDPTSTTQPWYFTLLAVILPAMLILIMLKKATDYAKKGGGVLGEMIMGGVKAVGGLAIGAITGGTSLALQGGAKALTRGTLNDDKLRARAAGGDTDAQRRLDRANALASKSFDFRQTGLGKFAAKKSGLDFEAGTSVLGLGTEKLKGGFKAADKRKAEKEEARIKSYMMTPSEAEAQDEEAEKAENRNKEGDKQYQIAQKAANTQNARADQYEIDKKEAKARMEEGGATFDEKEFREKYEKGEHLSVLGKDVKPGSVDHAEEVPEFEHEKVIDSKKINDERRKAFNVSLLNPTARISGDGKVMRNEDGEIVKKGLEDFGRLFKEGVKDMVTSKGGLTATAMAGAITGPVGAALTPFIGGLAHAVKTVAKAEIQTAFPKTLGFDKDMAASLRKGIKDDKETAWEHMQHAFGGGHDKAHGGEEHPSGGGHDEVKHAEVKNISNEVGHGDAHGGEKHH